MRKQMRRRPEVERLESMTLLSGVAAHAATPTIPHPLVLSGSIHGSLLAKGASKTSGVVNASGTFPLAGKLTFKGSLAASATGSETGSLTATSTKLGKLFVTVNLTRSATSFTGTYQVTGGTGAFANESGSGNVQGTFTKTGKLNATFG
jgi:hypothetical protein